MRSLLATASRGLAAGATQLVRALTLIMLAVLAYQVFMRSVLARPPSWTEEVALLCFAWAVLLGLACGVREGVHVRMDLLLQALPSRLQAVLERLVLAAVAFLGGFLAWAGWRYTGESMGTTSAAIAYPMPLLYASSVACGALTMIFALERWLLHAGAVGTEETR